MRGPLTWGPLEIPMEGDAGQGDAGGPGAHLGGADDEAWQTLSAAGLLF